MKETNNTFHEVYGDAWDLLATGEYILFIPTNGFVKKNGKAVMGAGVAQQAAIRDPDIPTILGYHLKIQGNVCHYLCSLQASFPTKYNWWEKSDIELIKTSCNQAVSLLDNLEQAWEHPLKALLPKPGCGNGGLSWTKEVKPAISNLLDDRFYIIDKKRF